MGAPGAAEAADLADLLAFGIALDAGDTDIFELCVDTGTVVVLHLGDAYVVVILTLCTGTSVEICACTFSGVVEVFEEFDAISGEG